MNQTDSLNLDELIEAVSAELRRLGLETLPDRRASLLPDVRMVRYYTSMGLLKPPKLVQRQAHYDQGHVGTLLLIKLLQVKGHSLARIQQELLGSSDSQRQDWLAQLRASLAEGANDAQTAPPVSWQEYVLEPGLRLQLRSDYACTNPDAILRQVQSLLQAHSTQSDTKDAKQAKDGSQTP